MFSLAMKVDWTICGDLMVTTNGVHLSEVNNWSSVRKNQHSKRRLAGNVVIDRIELMVKHSIMNYLILGVNRRLKN